MNRNPVLRFALIGKTLGLVVFIVGLATITLAGSGFQQSEATSFLVVSVSITGIESSMEAAATDALRLTAGGTRTTVEVEAAADRLREHFMHLGYLDARVVPFITGGDREKHGSVLNFNVTLGPQFIVRRIEIHGNGALQDSQIRKTIHLVEGEAFTEWRVRESIDAINSIGLGEIVRRCDIETFVERDFEAAEFTVDVAIRLFQGDHP